jgi:hypothetical protein
MNPVTQEKEWIAAWAIFFFLLVVGIIVGLLT